MKILFITNDLQCDLLHDMVLHGLRNEFGEDCIDTFQRGYMYKDLKEQWHKTWEKNNPRDNDFRNNYGVTGLLEDIKVDRTDIVSKIKNKFFDKIIYGSIRRCELYWDVVSQYYQPKDIIFIEAEDDQELYDKYVEKGIYYKREMIYLPDYWVRPISFVFPKESVVKQIPKKTKNWATTIPGQRQTYIFKNKQDYYNDYQQSYCAITHKKGGWDCMRHIEIMANGCLPFFPWLEHCPRFTMHHYPKQLLRMTNQFLYDKSIPSDYNEIIEQLLIHVRTNMTTESLVRHILQTKVSATG